MSEMNPDVIVVGGGFAGVTAARQLATSGRTVALLEARDRLGGRTWYREFADLDQKIEIGGTWTVDAHQPHIAAEKSRYGLGTITSPDPANWRNHLGGRVVESSIPVVAEDAVDFERAMFSIISDAHRIDFGTPYDAQDVADLDISLQAYLKNLEVPPGVTDFFSSFGGIFMGTRPDEISALHLISWVSGMGNSAWMLATTLTEKFAAGTVSLIDAMVTDAGAEIRLETPVAAVAYDREGATVRTRAGETLHAEAVIMATPMNTWADIEFSPGLAGGKLAAAEEKHAGHAVKIFALARNVPSYLGSYSHDGGLDWLSTEFELEEGALMVGFAPSPDIVDIDDPADVARIVKEIVPEAEVIATDGHNWVDDEFSRGTWLALRPGQPTRLHSELQSSDGRLFFAGSDIAPRWAGWIEGAIESGELAAESVEALLRERQTA
jgi:monoamine oxidase